MRKIASSAAFRAAIASAVLAAVVAINIPVFAEPLLLVYPNGPAVFRFDAERYELLPADGSSQSFGIGGVLLWDKIAQRIPAEVYRAPYLTGFEPSPNGRNEFVTIDTEFKIIIDGYSPHPWTVSNLHVRFLPDQAGSAPSLIVGGVAQNSNICEVPGFTVSTPTGDGFYSGSSEVHVRWYGAATMRIVAYVDKNGNGVYDDGVPAWSILALEDTVPARETTWGGIKALFLD